MRNSFTSFGKKRDKLFESYEDQEGQCHGNPPAPTIQPAGGSGARRRLTIAEVEAMTDEDEPNSMDAHNLLSTAHTWCGDMLWVHMSCVDVSRL